jgi:hypothetical protein
MLQRLDYDEDGDVRGQFDMSLDVRSWRVPGQAWEAPVARVVEIDGEMRKAPAWWRGDEDASQSFLAQMGVTLDG